MFTEELKNLLFQVVTSWQVSAVSIALIFYMSLVSYAARAHHKPASVSRTKPKKQKKPKAAAKPVSNASAEPEITSQD
jgi:hypothetical protein